MEKEDWKDFGKQNLDKLKATLIKEITDERDKANFIALYPNLIYSLPFIWDIDRFVNMVSNISTITLELDLQNIQFYI